MSIDVGTLYIVATPIGHLDDLSRRALEVLRQVDLIAAEDTRHSGRMLRGFGIDTPLKSFHDHNERRAGEQLVERLRTGSSVALISDAGTPLICDPGYHLVRAAHAAGIPVSPVPGPSAVIALLSASGFAADRFVFEGFLASRAVARQQTLQGLSGEQRTLVFYEAPHRIQDTLADMSAVFGAQREAVIARELTKRFETICRDTLGGLVTWLGRHEDNRRGEFVIAVHGAPPVDNAAVDAEALRILALALAQLSTRDAASLTSRITGISSNRLYQAALGLKA